MSFLFPPAHLPVVELTSDASGSWGCGAWHGGAWFHIRWDSCSEALSIAEKELLPIVLGCAAWGRAWAGRWVIWSLRQSGGGVLPPVTHRGIMHLLRCLVFIESSLGFVVASVYINTRSNHLADDLSRDNLASFLQKVPRADKDPTPTSPQLLELLLDRQADWNSQTGRPRFSSIFRVA